MDRSGDNHAGPSSAAQFKAIAWIRWRLFVNGFRRKGGKGELVARIILLPFVALVAVGPIVGAGAGAYFAVNTRANWALSLLMWVVFGGWIFVTSATTLQPTRVDLSLLLRFPISFPSYVITRFFFGLLSTPNVIGTLALAAAALGIGLAQPSLFPWAAATLGSYALMMILLLRMVLQWMERWMAQRRTREIFSLLFTMFFLSFQFLNFEMQGWAHHRHGPRGFARFAFLLPYYRAVKPFVEALPPALAAKSIARMQTGHALAAFGSLAAVLAFGIVFGSLYSLRLLGEFRGENFNEAPARPRVAKDAKEAQRSGFDFGGLPPAIAAGIEKELRYLVRGPSMLLGVLTPLVLVALYANRLGSFELLLPGAMAYTLFALLPTLYNVLGQDAAGAQLYLLSPTPIRTVFLAKNLVSSALIVCVAGAAALLVAYAHPPSPPIAVGTALWFAFVLLTNLSLGNFRSIQSPMKVDMGKVQRRQGASQVSVLIVLAGLFGSLLTGFVLLWVCRYLGHIWAAPAALLVLAVAALLLYLRTLNRIGRVALENRDVLVEVLGKG